MFVFRLNFGKVPKIEPPVVVDDGSTVRTATRLPFSVIYLPNVSIKLLLPAP